MERANQVQIEDEKPIDPYMALKKVIKLDRRLKNFDYHDSTHNVHIHVNYPSSADPLPTQHLLKSFWRHLQNFYFKPIQDVDLSILDYICNLVHEPIKNESWYNAPPAFWHLLEQVFQDSYLKKFPKSPQDHQYHQNLITTLYGYYMIMSNQSNQPGKSQKEQIRKLKEALGHLKNQQHQNYRESLKNEEKHLRNIIPPSHKDYSEISNEIERLQEELKIVNKQNKKIINKLNSRVRKQVNQKAVSVCLNNNDDEDEETIYEKNLRSHQEHIVQVKENDLKLQYLRHLILNLEKKQVAESICKINRIERSKGEIRFAVTFQKGMNVDSKLLTEKQLVKLNNLRQYSLVKFYTTSLKSQFSFICQNFYGFSELYNHRNRPCELKNKNILEGMKNTKYESKDPSNKAFNNFQICHHCKLLYPENLLMGCGYTSDKLGAPIQPTPYYDPYLSQISKLDGATTQRFSSRRRNPYMGYIKTDQEYRCQRKFCKYCLKQNYEEGMDKNGLCPFCQGICFCTRCSRNDMIFRIKSMFLLLGGDISEIHQASELQKLKRLDSNSEDQLSTRKKQPIKAIKKKKQGHFGKSTKKLLSIREEMEQCRILCDMVKKRQKEKYKLVKLRSSLFQQKIKVCGQNYDPKRKLSEMDWADDNEQDNVKTRKKIHK